MPSQNPDLNKDSETDLQLKEYTENLENTVEELSKELAQSELMYKDVLNEMLHVVNIIDEDLTIIWANKTAIEEWGDIVGKKCYDKYKGRNSECPDCTVRQVFKEGKNLQTERASICPDGRRKFFIVTSSPLKDLQGNVIAVIEMLTDIGERKKLERKIKESEERLKAILTGIGDLITIQNKDLDISWVNQPIRDLWGDVIGRKCYEAYKGLTEPCSDCTVEKVFAEGKTVVSERSSILPDKSSIQIWTTSSPVHDAEGNIIAVVEVMKDITERKQLESQLKEYTENLERIVEDRTKALRGSEEMLKAILTATGDLIGIHDKDLNVIWTNQSIKDIYGEIIGKKCYTAYKGFTNPCPECTIETVLTKDKTIVSEQSHIRPDGRLRHVLVTSSPLRDAEGNVTAIVESAKDITKRKILEKQLAESEKRYRGLYESSLDGIASVAMDGAFLECNQAYADMLGYSKEEIYQLTSSDVMPKKWHSVLEKVITEQVISRDYSDELEIEYIKKDGSIFPVSLKLWQIRDKDGTPLGRWGIARDITERKKLEEMKSQFINVAAHELRTPLSALKAHADLLKIKNERGYWDLPEEVRNKINIITRNADRLAVLINNLLDYTRLEAGTVKPRMEFGSLKKIVSKVIKEILPLARKHAHKLDFHSTEALPLICMDQELIHIIFSNLLSNAIKYTPDGGTIEITILEEKDLLHTTVKDTGIGIAEKDLKKIFLPFHVADAPDDILYKSEFERTGLGLAITKEYVKIHDGKIWAESRIGEGSIFHVLLPKKKMELPPV
jgi:PAS domain S-box-containing protein